MNKKQKELIIYQGKNGSIEFRGDFNKETIWGTQRQIANIFNVHPQAITKHIKNIYRDQELKENQTCSKMEQVQKEGKKKVKRMLNFYNLDMIISIGYRVNSKQATQFRIWATKTLKLHLIKGYTINKKQIRKNYIKFMQAVDNIKTLLPSSNKATTKDILELINTFANTWLSLDAYDTNSFPNTGLTKKKISFNANELSESLNKLKEKLIAKKQATNLFGQRKDKDSVESIIGNVFQSMLGKDVYPTSEEKAAHLLYFIIKNHPFIDGNKRSGAFAFIWFLRKTNLLRTTLTPEVLTTLTLLIAESNPKDKDKMIGLALLLLRK